MACRLIVDDPEEGPWNMAVDEALLQTCCASEAAAPTVRLYAWRAPTLSLGRSQPASASHDPLYLRRAAIDLVRRPTGGGAVLHEHERTYAVVGRLRREPFAGGLVDAFQRIALALKLALRGLGLDVCASADPSAARPRGTRGAACFGSAAEHEITWRGLKLVGSAQVRRRGAFLQHGSILIRADPRRLAAAVGAREAVGGFTDLEAALGFAPAPEALDAALVRGFEDALGGPLSAGQLSPEEYEQARRLRAEKYTSSAWTLGVKSSPLHRALRSM